MSAVKSKMLSRRRFLKGSAAGAVAVATSAAGTSAMAQGHSSVEDMTHTLHEDFPTYFGESQFSREQLFSFAKDSFNLYRYTVNEHTGTHVDAPLHFSEDGACVAMHSGWSPKVDTKGFRNYDGTAQHYPGFHVEVAQMLLETTRAASIAVDTLSLDHGISADFATHYAWLPSGRFGETAGPSRPTCTSTSRRA